MELRRIFDTLSYQKKHHPLQKSLGYNKDGKWRSYRVLPRELKEVQQIGLGMPKEGRDGGD